MKITNEQWQVVCRDKAHKGELFDYAESKGVPVLDGPIKYQDHGGASYREDDDLFIGWLEDSPRRSGLVSDSHGRSFKTVTEAEFKAMCDAYTQQP